MEKKSSKKTPAKVAKKVTKKDVHVTAKPAEELTVAPVRFVSFTFGATIPSQPYGNVQAHITVEAGTYEDALGFVTPKIEELYAKYAETKPAFLGRVTETVKEVIPVPMPSVDHGNKPQTDIAQFGDTAVLPSQPLATVTVVSTETAAPVGMAPTVPAGEAPKSEPVMRAERAIGLAMTEDAALKIKEQIENSVKIAPEDKPALIALVEAKITDFQSNIW